MMAVRNTSNMHIINLWIDKRNHNVTCTVGNQKTLMEVSKSTRVHKHPALLRVCYGAIVTQETATASLVVNASPVHCDIDRVRGGVVVGAQ